MAVTEPTPGAPFPALPLWADVAYGDALPWRPELAAGPWQPPAPTAPVGEEPHTRDLQGHLEPLLEAWKGHVPPGLCSADDLRGALENELRALERAWDRTAPRPGPAENAEHTEDTTHATGNARGAAAAVNAALAEAGTRAAAFRQLPEWQRLQTVCDTVQRLWHTLRTRAGGYWDALSSDIRFQGFWRTVSIRACTAIARLSLAAAGRLARHEEDGRENLPGAATLTALSRAASTYSACLSGRSVHDPQTAAAEVIRSEARRLREAVRTDAPLPYATRDEAIATCREITLAFVRWSDTPMGRQLLDSGHPKVAAFRNAWHRLPATSLPTGPGPAAGPYGEVAERALAVAEAATTSGRFASGDVEALRSLAAKAEEHAARLTATLPSSVSGAGVTRAQSAPASTPPPRRGRSRTAASGPGPTGPRTPRASA